MAKSVAAEALRVSGAGSAGQSVRLAGALCNLRAPLNLQAALRLARDCCGVDPQLIHEKAPQISPFFDLFADGFARAMTGLGVDADQDGCWSRLCVLQSCG